MKHFNLKKPLLTSLVVSALLVHSSVAFAAPLSDAEVKQAMQNTAEELSNIMKAGPAGELNDQTLQDFKNALANCAEQVNKTAALCALDMPIRPKNPVNWKLVLAAAAVGGSSLLAAPEHLHLTLDGLLVAGGMYGFKLSGDHARQKKYQAELQEWENLNTKNRKLARDYLLASLKEKGIVPPPKMTLEAWLDNKFQIPGINKIVAAIQEAQKNGVNVANAFATGDGAVWDHIGHDKSKETIAFLDELKNSSAGPQMEQALKSVLMQHGQVDFTLNSSLKNRQAKLDLVFDIKYPGNAAQSVHVPLEFETSATKGNFIRESRNQWAKQLMKEDLFTKIGATVPKVSFGELAAQQAAFTQPQGGAPHNAGAGRSGGGGASGTTVVNNHYHGDNVYGRPYYGGPYYGYPYYDPFWGYWHTWTCMVAFDNLMYHPHVTEVIENYNVTNYEVSGGGYRNNAPTHSVSDGGGWGDSGSNSVSSGRNNNSGGSSWDVSGNNGRAANSSSSNSGGWGNNSGSSSNSGSSWNSGSSSSNSGSSWNSGSSSNSGGGWDSGGSSNSGGGWNSGGGGSDFGGGGGSNSGGW